MDLSQLSTLHPIDPPMWLEGTMLLCFGLAWPLANLAMWRSRRPQGKGLGFTSVVLAGYLCGAGAKLLLAAGSGSLAPVFWLYALNASSVGANLALQWYFRPRGAVPSPTIQRHEDER
ncbi:MAG: hypothetical protein JSR75_11060 [Proteobacteria bacterium]|nr:hypothetical protein [Pseudomonadota bacterium]